MIDMSGLSQAEIKKLQKHDNVSYFYFSDDEISIQTSYEAKTYGTSLDKCYCKRIDIKPYDTEADLNSAINEKEKERASEDAKMALFEEVNTIVMDIGTGGTYSKVTGNINKAEKYNNLLTNFLRDYCGVDITKDGTSKTTNIEGTEADFSYELSRISSTMRTFSLQSSYDKTNGYINLSVTEETKDKITHYNKVIDEINERNSGVDIDNILKYNSKSSFSSESIIGFYNDYKDSPYIKEFFPNGSPYKKNSTLAIPKITYNTVVNNYQKAEMISELLIRMGGI
ncbi:MAG: hypothetical protein PHH04_03735 [Thomasclavelia sp.]|nr:hypothetical protein [Thomasclavelia sp.]